MRILAVMAHYDAQGLVAPHALRNMDALGRVADRLLVVSTAGLEAPEQIKEIESRAELVRRVNFGYDFYSYKTGLDLVDDLTSYDLVIVCNDSFVGPLRPYREIIDSMAHRPVDFWGITATDRRAPHVQSYFVAFRSWVVRSQAFAGFWRAMTPISDRARVITRYEVGMSTSLVAGGFRAGSYYVESPQDRRLARARHLWWAYHRLRAMPAGKRRRVLAVLPREAWNPMSALADKALHDAALPLVKIDTLRYDPYGLGSEALLTACERAYPQAFEGVRPYLDRTAELYPVRRGELSGSRVPPVGLRRLIGYPR